MTNISKKLIENIIKDNYSIGHINKIEKIPNGSASVFYIESTNNRNYVLKIFQDFYTEQDILKEVKIIELLKSNNINVPVYIKTKDNEYFCKHEKSCVIMQKYISGNVKKLNEGNKKQLIDSAKNFADIVIALEKMDNLKLDNVKDWFSKEKINKALNNYKELIKQCDISIAIEKRILNDLKEKSKMLEQIKIISFEMLDNITYKNTHGDYNVLQLIYDENDNIKATIDFVSAKRLPIVWELIRSYSYIDKECKNGEFNIDNFVEYVKQFSKKVALNKFDLEYMPYIYLVQILTSTFGYKQYFENKNSSIISFGFFRTKLAKYLYEYSEIIVTKLKEELL